MHDRTTVLLPHGLVADDGSWLRLVGLRELNGYDEEQLSAMRNASALVRSKAILKRVIEFVDSTAQPSEDFLARLTVGDMTALMLYVRRITFGEYLSCVINCPVCNKDTSMDMNINQLLQAPLPEPKEIYEISVGNYTLKIRAATAFGPERSVEKNSQLRTAEKLIRSCIISSEPELPTEIDNDLVEKISSRLIELDPQADLVLVISCPNCNHGFQTPFFPEDFVLREIDVRERQVEKEIHWLAFNYHWTEDAILSLPVSKRKRYVDLINRTLSGESL